MAWVSNYTYLKPWHVITPLFNFDSGGSFKPPMKYDATSLIKRNLIIYPWPNLTDIPSPVWNKILQAWK